MKKFWKLLLLMFLLTPSVVMAGECGPSYCRHLCYEIDGRMFHCVTPEATQPAYSGLVDIGQPDLATLILASDGLDDAAISNLRYFNSNGTHCAITDYEKYNDAVAARNGTLSADKIQMYYAKYGSASMSIDGKVSWTEVANWQDPLITSSTSSRVFSKKYHLEITISGDTSGVSLNYNISVSGGGVFNYETSDVSGSLSSGNLSMDVVVYSNEKIRDLSTVTLNVNVNASKSYRTVTMAVGGGAQKFIGPGLNEGVATKNFSGSASFPVTKTCQYEIKTDAKTGQEYPEYTLHIVRPGTSEAEEQKVDAITYMSKGCCSDVQPKFFNTTTEEGRQAIEYYKNNCMTKDLVSYENSCGSDSCDGTGNYKSYSTSFVWQVPMDTLKKNVLNDTKFEDINNDNTNLNHYYDETLSNKYCKVVTSEENEIYFPTTAVATSGRFFVFQELDKTKCDLSGLNYNSKTCFRQPYIKGSISLYVVTDYNSWKSDYDEAVSKKTSSCGNASGSDAASLTNSVACQEATEKVNSLISAKSACENNVNNFSYNLEPKLTFYYDQEYYSGSSTAKKTESIEMYATKETDEPVKYWPNVTSKVTKENNTTYSFESGGVYENTYEKTVYYRPSLNSYSLLPSGEVKTSKYQSSSSMMENGLDIGYVYNITVTSYEGTYNTWFDITDLGNGGATSNLQKMTIEEYKQASKIDYGNIDTDMFKSQCKYCIEEGSFERECPTCEELEAKFVFRNVALNDVTPNERDTDTNWVDEKGEAAKWLIEKNSGYKIAVSEYSTSDDKELLASSSINSTVTTLENTETDIKTNLLSGIYDDTTDEFLEYDITLTTEDMQMIKANNRKITYDTLSICPNNYTTNSTKSADADYCFKCNADGKECESTFIDAYADATVTSITRQSKWKYFFYNPTTKTGEFKKGSMKTISEFENGRYPAPENSVGYLNTYKNWP